MVTVYCDSSIAMPLIATAVVQRYKEAIQKRVRPNLLEMLAKNKIEGLKRALDFSFVV